MTIKHVLKLDIIIKKNVMGNIMITVFFLVKICDNKMVTTTCMPMIPSSPFALKTLEGLHSSCLPLWLGLITISNNLVHHGT